MGDNFVVGGISPLVEEFRQNRPDAQILPTRVTDPRAFTAYGRTKLAGEPAVLAELPDDSAVLRTA